MAALLVALAVMSIMLSAALPVWRNAAKRELEAELIFRGEQYARSIVLFQRKYAGALPPNLQVLIDQHFLRKKYRDPMVKDGEFQLLYQTTTTPQAGAQPGRPAGAQAGSTIGQPSTSIGGPTSVGGGTASPGARGGITGVVSKSKEKALRLYNGRDKYSEWQFSFLTLTQRPGAVPGMSPRPGLPPGKPGQPGPGAPGTGPRPGFPGGPARPGFPSPRTPGPGGQPGTPMPMPRPPNP